VTTVRAQGSFQLAAPSDAQGPVRAHTNHDAAFYGHLDQDFTVAPVLIQQTEEVCHHGLGLCAGRHTNQAGARLALKNLIQQSNFVNDDRSLPVVRDLQFACHQNGCVIYQMGFVPAETFGPQDTFDAASLILQAQQSEASSLLCRP